jgi:3',5'-cyclic-AMP phosphodiesterase
MRDLRPACIVDLGDRINSVAAGQDAVRERYVRRRLGEAGVPVYSVLGNTDVHCLPKHEALAAAGKQWAAELVVLGPLRLILLDTVDPLIDGAGGAVGEAQLGWLRAALSDRDARCLVFGHHPLDEPDVAGHRYFAGRPDLGAVQNRADVRAVLEQGPVLAAFAGHLHRTGAAWCNDVPYVTVGSLVEGTYTGGEPAGTYGLVTAGPDSVDVTVWGRVPAQFSFSRRSRPA